MIWSRTRHTNALRNALREYYPAALVAFDDLAHGDALGVPDRAPTPEQGVHLSRSAIHSALKHAGRQRNLDARAQQIAAVLRTEQLAAPTTVTAAFAATTRATVGIIVELNRQITDSYAETSLGPPTSCGSTGQDQLPDGNPRSHVSEAPAPHTV